MELLFNRLYIELHRVDIEWSHPLSHLATKLRLSSYVTDTDTMCFRTKCWAEYLELES
jgi:hypothetical protein